MNGLYGPHPTLYCQKRTWGPNSFVRTAIWPKVCRTICYILLYVELSNWGCILTVNLNYILFFYISMSYLDVSTILQKLICNTPILKQMYSYNIVEHLITQAFFF